MELRILGSLSFLSFMTLMLVLSQPQVYASDNAKLKTFKDKNGAFTIQYPSNWSPLKIDEEEEEEEEEEEYTSLINVAFTYQGKGTSFAVLNLFAEAESLFTNATDKIDSSSASKQNYEKYKVIQPVECGKYTLNQLNACSQIEEFRLELEGYSTRPLVNQLTVGAIDDDGTEFVVVYTASQKQFDDFLPDAADMIKSFETTGTAVMDDDASVESGGESPALPPLS